MAPLQVDVSVNQAPIQVDLCDKTFVATNFLFPNVIPTQVDLSVFFSIFLFPRSRLSFQAFHMQGDPLSSIC